MTASELPLRVLVVDDLRDTTDIMCVLFEALGHDPRGAMTGTEALAIAEQHDPQLCLLDIGLPDLSGYELAREIRRRAGDKKIYIVAVTGWGTSHDRVRAIAAGFDQHVLKPTDERTIRSIIEEARRALSTTSGEARPS